MRLSEHLIAKTRPQANAANIVRWKEYRVTILQDRLFRLEKNATGNYRDEATQTVWFRDMEKQGFTVELSENKAVIQTAACTLELREKRAACRISLGNGKPQKIDNVGNLKGTYRTLDACDGNIRRDYVTDEETKIELGLGVCSKTGVAVYHDENSLTLAADGEVKPQRGEGTDEYIFAYGNDYRSAVKALYLITGKTPLVPRYALGNWWSRYHEYTQEEYLRLLNRFDEHGVPLTVATIDMDWHWSHKIEEEKGIAASGRDTEKYIGKTRPAVLGWTGYSWNTRLFPTPQKFLKDIKDRHLKITLNLHPADGVRYWEDCYENMAKAMGRDATTGELIPFDIASPQFINAYFSVLHKPHEKDGVDFWWIDWQQGKNSNMEGLDPLWSLNHYHYYDNAVNHSAPLILSRYAGVGSHRYPLGFSGDTYISWETLRYLPYFTSTASNIGYTWWSHDIGGHYDGEKDDDLYVRHVQFGVFSPINRLHCSNSATLNKEPWLFENGAGQIAMEWLRLRHKMISYLYAASYATHKEGNALIEPLYYYWDLPEAYAYKNEYVFAGELLVASATQKRRADGYTRFNVWIPEGTWTDIFTGHRYVAPAGGCKCTLLRTLDSIPVLIRAGGVLPLSAVSGNACDNPEKLDVSVYTGCGKYTLFEDGREHEDVREVFTDFQTEYTQTEGVGMQILRISTRGERDVIPQNRVMRILFRDIPDGEVEVYENGQKLSLKKELTDCAAAKIAFNLAANYEVKVRFAVKTELERQKENALAVLLRVCGNNKLKMNLYQSLQKTQTLDEFVSVIDEADVAPVVKLLLKETL